MSDEKPAAAAQEVESVVVGNADAVSVEK